MIVSALDPDSYDVLAIDTQDPAALISAARPQITAPTAESADAGGTAIAAAATSSLPAAGAAQVPEKPDVVFIALHGRGGEDGTLQGLLEFLGVPIRARVFWQAPSLWIRLWPSG